MSQVFPNQVFKIILNFIFVEIILIISIYYKEILTF